jgi:hypothetical protein
MPADPSTRSVEMTQYDRNTLARARMLLDPEIVPNPSPQEKARIRAALARMEASYDAAVARPAEPDPYRAGYAAAMRDAARAQRTRVVGGETTP